MDELGGSVQCIPFIRAEVEESAWGYEERYRQKQDIVVGVNQYVTEQVDEVEILRVDPESERQQLERLRRSRPTATQEAVAGRASTSCATPAGGTDNLLHPMRAALKERASLGEVCGVMREEFGEYSEVSASLSAQPDARRRPRRAARRAHPRATTAARPSPTR